MKNTTLKGLLITAAVLVLAACSNGGEQTRNVQKTYTVSIGTLTNANGSTISTYPESGEEGRNMGNSRTNIGVVDRGL